MEYQLGDATSDLAEKLCEVYRDQERCKALNLEISELILSSGNRVRREWVKLEDNSNLSGK